MSRKRRQPFYPLARTRTSPFPFSIFKKRKGGASQGENGQPLATLAYACEALSVDVRYFEPQIAAEDFVLQLRRKHICVRICQRILACHKRWPILRALPRKARHRKVDDPIVAYVSAELIDLSMRNG